jgi:hypothetical protein
MQKVALINDDNLLPEHRQAIITSLGLGEFIDAKYHVGQNEITIQKNLFAKALLLKDASKARKALLEMASIIKIVPHFEEGIKQDMAFHQHFSQLYNGGYGL